MGDRSPFALALARSGGPGLECWASRFLDPMPTASLRSALTIIRTLLAFNHDALLAGGCVRDRLLGVEPKDFDIATSARPEQVAEAFEKTEAVGAAFGVMLVI